MFSHVGFEGDRNEILIEKIYHTILYTTVYSIHILYNKFLLLSLKTLRISSYHMEMEWESEFSEYTELE